MAQGLGEFWSLSGSARNVWKYSLHKANLFPHDKENRPFGWPRSAPCARLLIIIVTGRRQAFQMNPIEPICIQDWGAASYDVF